MSTQQDQEQKALLTRVSEALSKSENERELAVSILSAANKMASNSIQLAAQQNMHSLSAASAGFSIFGILLSVMAFFHAINDFLKGDTFSLPHFGKMTALGAVVTLSIIGVAIPPLGAAMAVATATVGLVMAGYQLVHHFYEKFSNLRQLKHLNVKLEHLNNDTAEDGKRLNYMVSQSKDILSATTKSEFETALKEIESRQAERKKEYEKIEHDLTTALIKKSELSHSATIERCITVIGSALAIAAAIVFFVNPFTAGILAGAAAATSIALTARMTFKYFKHKWEAAKSAPTLQAQPTPSKSAQESPQQVDEEHETIKKSIQPHPSANRDISENQMVDDFHETSTPQTLRPQPLNEPLSHQEQECNEIKEELHKEETPHKTSKILEEQPSPLLLFSKPDQSKKTPHEDDDENENEDDIDREH